MSSSGSSSSKRRSFSREFKVEAVRLVLEKGVSVAQAARELGINESLLHSWKRRYLSDPSFRSGKGPSAEQQEIQRLRKELARVEQEREILKKAAAYFAKESQ